MDIKSLTGLDSGFSYHNVTSMFEENLLRKYCESTRRKFSTHTKTWSDEKNAEWVVRNYLSIKMILTATLMLTSLEYCTKRNVKIVEPYLYYYSILCCSRFLIFLTPSIDWNHGEILVQTHSKIINLTVDILSTLSNDISLTAKKVLSRSKSLRELYSYRFPASGLRSVPPELKISFEEAIGFCSLLCELSQINSEMLQSSVNKHVLKEYDLNDSILEKCFEYEFQDFAQNEVILDDEDYYRLGFIIRRVKKPLNLFWLMTEGLVEDFFGAWLPEDGAVENSYDPDSNWGIIFPFL